MKKEDESQNTIKIEIECKESNDGIKQPSKISPIWIILVLLSGVSTFLSFSMLTEQEHRDFISNFFIFSLFAFLFFLYILISKVQTYYSKFGSDYDSSRDCFDD